MQDLSHMVNPATALNAGESMSAGNTVTLGTAKVAMAAPGSQPVNANPTQGFASDTPEMEIPPVKNYKKTVS